MPSDAGPRLAELPRPRPVWLPRAAWCLAVVRLAAHLAPAQRSAGCRAPPMTGRRDIPAAG